jgi:hypothetical protein
MIALQAASACADDGPKRERPPPKPMSGTGMMRNLGPGTNGPSVGIGTPPTGTTSTGTTSSGRSAAPAAAASVLQGEGAGATADAGVAE